MSEIAADGGKLVVVERSGSTATVRLNRPEIHNAFDERVIAEVTSTVADLGGDPSIRAIVLTGAGDSFCAGADLTWMKRMAAFTRDENVADAMGLHRMLAAAYNCPKVTIARVNGSAFGGGAGLLAACDIAIAADHARFGFTEVRLGIAPAVISPFVLQRMGLGAARAKFVTGERFDASEALRIGLVDRVVPAGELENAVEQITQAVAKCGPHAIAATKQLLREIAGKSPDQAAAITSRTIADLRASTEGQEGIRAFLEKRKPLFVQE